VRNIAFHADAFEELRAWAETDKKLHLKILDLLDDVARSPFTGLGKPEPLKGEWQGYWSRRINDEHRLIYRVTDTEIVVMRCRGHYV
jgi:toxin YoeB